MNKPRAIPEQYGAVTPYLIINGAAEALKFYKEVFGATEIMRFPGPDGTIGHAEIRINGSVIMLTDGGKHNVKDPIQLGGSPVGIMLYVEDVDQVVEKAVASGAKVTQPVENKFYGDRLGSLTDPFGHIWHVATHIEDVSEEEMRNRLAALAGGKG